MNYKAQQQTRYFTSTYCIYTVEPKYEQASIWYDTEEQAKQQLEYLQNQCKDTKYEIEEKLEPLLYWEAYDKHLIV